MITKGQWSLKGQRQQSPDKPEETAEGWATTMPHSENTEHTPLQDPLLGGEPQAVGPGREPWGLFLLPQDTEPKAPLGTLAYN